MSYLLPLTRLLLRWPVLSAYAMTHLVLYLLWFALIGRSTWGPAWPTLRTGFVIGILASCLCSLALVAYATWCRILAPRTDNQPKLPDLYVYLNCIKQRATATKQPLPNSIIYWVALVWALFGVFLCATYQQPDDYRFKSGIENVMKSHGPPDNLKNERVFIAAMFYNNEDVVPFWSREIIRAIHYLGMDNVFVSIVESNSNDDTAGHLVALQQQLNSLGIRNKMIIGDKTIKRPPSMETKPPRIEYLSALRNLALEPLNELDGIDVVLFSNDVFVEAESIIELLYTRNGDWDMVCGIDKGGWGLYDAWVARDANGKLVSSLWPYLLDDAGGKAVFDEEPAPVFACWNGIVAIRADPFLHPGKRHPLALSNITTHTLPPTHPAFNLHRDTPPAHMPPLRFRSSAASECFSSESFLLPYDLRRQFGLQKIFMNPRVVIAYEWRFYIWYKYILRHWLIRWYMRAIEGINKESMKEARLILGKPEEVWTWDGGECHPWW